MKNIINEYLTNIQESIIISQNPLKYKFDEWEKSKNGKLFIVGQSGSGKTTFSHELEKKYNVPVIHLDDYILIIFKKYYPSEYKKYIIDRHDTDRKKVFGIVINKMFDEILKMNKKLIIEGLQILWIDRKKLFESGSIILIRTSNFISFKRRLIRNLKMRKETQSILYILLDAYSNLFIKIINQFEQELKEKIND